MPQTVVRVRYAPSPTGLQHIGGIRTALFNYLLARKSLGSFILRVEDTDRERFQKEAIIDLQEIFQWLNLQWDEGPFSSSLLHYGPYMQSQRKELYQKYIDQLIVQKEAYYCFCSSVRLDKLRKLQSLNKMSLGYDRRCRYLSEEEQKERLDNHQSYVVRFKLPIDQTINVHDLILGEMEFNTNDLPVDPVLLKSDAWPTYHLANIVDDHLMQISHVLRSQEWVPSLPLHICLYRALAWEIPQFCHLPMVLGTDGKKLSKRHGSVSLRDLKEQGYLAEAIINYISLLGWSPGTTQEFFHLKELEEIFSLANLSKSPAVFDFKKLNFFNAHYIKKMSDLDLKKLLWPYIQTASFYQKHECDFIEDQVDAALPFIKERINTLSEVNHLIEFLFLTELALSKDLLLKKTKENLAYNILSSAVEYVRNNPEYKKDIRHFFNQEMKRWQCKAGQYYYPLRVALSAQENSLPLFNCLELLSQDLVCERWSQAIQCLDGE